MKRIIGLPSVACQPGAAGLAQSQFPVDKSYKAISISGFDVQNKGLSMTVSRRSEG